MIAESGLDLTELIETLVSNPAAVELFVDAVPAAAERTSSELKRRQLAKVVGSALLVGPDDARVDAATVLDADRRRARRSRRTRPIVLGTARPATGHDGQHIVGYMTDQDIAAAMGETPADLLGRVLGQASK